MTSAPDLVQATADRLTRVLEIDANLGEVVAALGDGSVADGASAAKLLDERVKALREAAVEIDRLRTRVSHQIEVLPYTEAGWATRRGELEEAFAADFTRGLSAWLAEWAAAAAAGRLDAQRRIALEIDVPPAAQLARERLALANWGIDVRNPPVAAPVVSFLAGGIDAGGETLLDEEVRAGLWILVARLALSEGSLETAAAALERADRGPRPRVTTLRSRLARLAGDGDRADELLDDARAADPTSIDVAIETIDRPMGELHEEFAMEAARLAIDSLPSAASGERDLLARSGEVPSVIWLALAERSVRERDFDCFAWAAGEIAKSGAGEAELATVAQMKVAVAAEQAVPESERVELLIELGTHLIGAESAEEAIPALEKALVIAPGHDRAMIVLADALIASTEGDPDATVEKAERALSLVSEARRHATVAPAGWTYLLEASAHLLLGLRMGPESDAHQWQALDRACRGFIHTDTDFASVDWQVLTDVANTMQLRTVCEEAARNAVAAAPGDLRARSKLATALINAGKPSEAAEILGTEEDPWSQCVLAYAALLTGDPERAVRTIQALDSIPRHPWVSEIYVSALVLLGRHDEAREQAAMARERLLKQLAERNAREAAALMALILGDLDEVEALLEPVLAEGHDWGPTVRHGLVLILRGNSKSGIAAVEDALREGDRLGLLDWKTVSGRLLRILAERDGLALPSLVELDAELDRQLTERPASESIEELKSAQAGNADPDLVEPARALAVAILALGREDTERAAATLESAATRWPKDEDLQRLAKVLLDQRADLENAPQAPPQLGLVLPPSWFPAQEEDEATLRTHPFFVRYLPEMRVRTGWMVPGVAVDVDEDLEPDRHRVLLGTEAIAEGRIRLECLYMLPEAVSELGLPTAADNAPSPLGFTPIVVSELPDPHPYLDLLAVSPFELIARQIGALAEENAAAFGGGK